MVKKLLLLTFLFSSGILFGQNYISYLTGDAADVDSTSSGGYLLVGGGPDNDSAMTWFLEQANGGDVVVIRADLSNDYNQYLFDDLGVNVNSVETIVIPSVSAANSQYVRNRLLEAEAIFIAGGNQTLYYDLWNDTYVDTILSLSTTSSPVIGGTSAGMMILGDYDYYPTSFGVYSSEALNDPYHPYMDTIIDDGLIEKSKLKNLIFDSHFDNEDRKGRLITFMARTMELYSSKVSGIGLNEYTALAITNDGVVSKVFGDYPDYNDYAYFVSTTCPLSWINYMPEVMEPETPLTWDYDGRALKVYKIPGTPSGNGHIDIETFNNESGGSWEYWYVDSGEVYITPLNYEPDCFDLVSVAENKVQPYKFLDQYTIDFQNNTATIEVINMQGQSIDFQKSKSRYQLGTLPSGMYIIRYQTENETGTLKWVHP